MLIEFKVANYRSVKDEQTLSLVASKNRELADSGTLESGIPNVKLLPSSAIYGPNASGKTNLLLALLRMKRIVTESSLEKGRGDDLPIEPFKLDAKSLAKPSTFEVFFVSGGIRYQYGFSATEVYIADEWLFAFPEKRAQRWFSRTREKGEYQWEFGPSLKGEKKLWQKSTRDNALFLSTAVQLNSKQLQPVYDWFRDTLRLAGIGEWSPAFSTSLCETGDKNRILDFLKKADLGIDDIHVKEASRDLGPSPYGGMASILKKTLPYGGMPHTLKNEVAEIMERKRYRRIGEVIIEKEYEIKTVHKDSSGQGIEFDIGYEESDGTRKIFALAGPFLESLKKGYVVCIDELHDNLHPDLVKFLVGLFNNKETNTGHAQLIFTTHETSMLNQKVLRRDQIWFCEKDRGQATVLYPLTDFSPRKGVTNLEAAYLSGRYGAVPYIAESPQI
ncbi:MAG: ATP-binding protein [Gammaproteobacteria bacterium]|nr:ATP-binding protein [Paracoccaceae bacterium]MDD9869869.1 ATP-binding protein [Gammaproteobacteria bacterium]